MGLKCIVIDDDDFSIKILEKMIEKTDFLEFVAAYENPLKAVEKINDDKPDLIFLDVEMPEMSGFDFISAAGKGKNIIMTTSSEKHALESYNHDNILDYLLKPILDYGRFLRAALKAKDKNDAVNGNNLYSLKEAGSIFIKEDSVFNKVMFDDIMWVEAYGDYIKINTVNKLHTIYSTLTGVETKLPSSQFIRVHRSFIVNKEMISKIDQSALQIGGETIPIGNSFRKKLLASINVL